MISVTFAIIFLLFQKNITLTATVFYENILNNGLDHGFMFFIRFDNSFFKAVIGIKFALTIW